MAEIVTWSLLSLGAVIGLAALALWIIEATDSENEDD